MKKYTTTMQLKNGKSKTITVLIDDETAKILDTVDENARHEYLLLEHKQYLSELAETRRHISLDAATDNGWDVADEQTDVSSEMENEDSRRELLKAISKLTAEQQWLVKEVYIKGRSQTDIASELGVHKSTICHRLETISKKIKKILK